MKKRINNKGFTLAELLAVVAIVIALAAISFIAVQRHQRSMTRLEFDSIAKEVFIAAQNHLTMAESQGYLDESITYGKLDETTADNTDKKVYYLVINSGATDYGEAANLLLPYGAVDGNVLLGSILISYQPSTARVLDVFYSRPSNGTALTLAGTSFSLSEYETLMNNYRDGKATERQDYNGKVIGWYGDGDALPIGERLNAPEVVVHNEEKLWVEVQDTNSSVTAASLQLTITGETSGAKAAILIKGSGSSTNSRVSTEKTNAAGNKYYEVILDDITNQGLHFADLKAENKDKNGVALTFTPGENLVLEAVAYNNNALSNIAYSGKNTTNSLFAEVKRQLKSGSTTDYECVALIANFRHFENLDVTLSGFAFDKAVKKASTSESTTPEYEAITKAEQTQNLVWTGTISETVKPFIERIRVLDPNAPEKISIYSKKSETDTATELAKDNCLYPVDITTTNYVLAYDGKNHSIANVVVNHAGPSGIFGTISTANSSVSNLELIDFDITASNGNAGALAGIATSANITNVLAHNTVTYETKKASDITAITGSETADIAKKAAILQDITAPTSYDAGGLIGSATNCTVSKCAAALVVNGGTNAGGLIGSSSGSTVSACYSGGHTYSGTPDDAAQKYDDSHKGVYPARYYNKDNTAKYNVLASGASSYAGGLIGNAGSTTITNSYSTCSASGATVGGLIGMGTGTITNCYCTGLVSGTTAVGAFAGIPNPTMDGTKPSYYFEIVNEIRNIDKDGKLTSGYSYLTPLPIVGTGDGKNSSIKAFDASTSDYNKFTFPDDVSDYAWQTAHTYDSILGNYYQNKYNLKTVAQLGADVTDSDFVKDHYGDWPAPEEFIFN